MTVTDAPVLEQCLAEATARAMHFDPDTDVSSIMTTLDRRLQEAIEYGGSIHVPFSRFLENYEQPINDHDFEFAVDYTLAIPGKRRMVDSAPRFRLRFKFKLDSGTPISEFPSSCTDAIHQVVSEVAFGFLRPFGDPALFVLNPHHFYPIPVPGYDYET